jgi:nicotinamidase-related amidase
MTRLLKLKARYRKTGAEQHEMLNLSLPQTAFLLVDVYYDNQERGDWGDPFDPFVQYFKGFEANTSTALKAARGIGLQVIYAMNSSPRVALQRSSFGAHFARAWSQDGSLETFNRTFAEGQVDPREFHGGRERPLKISPSLSPQEHDLYIRKHVYSAFFDSRLDTALRNLGIKMLICAGLWANVCLAATALDALYRNYTVIWLRDCTLAGEENSEDLSDLPNTKRWVAWFEEVVGYTVTSAEFTQFCKTG